MWWLKSVMLSVTSPWDSKWRYYQIMGYIGLTGWSPELGQNMLLDMSSCLGPRERNSTGLCRQNFITVSLFHRIKSSTYTIHGIHWISLLFTRVVHVFIGIFWSPQLGAEVIVTCSFVYVVGGALVLCGDLFPLFAWLEAELELVFGVSLELWGLVIEVLGGWTLLCWLLAGKSFPRNV